MKSIVFNEQQLKARNSGAKMFLVPITHLNALAALQEYEDGEYRSEEKEFFEEIIRFYAPLQKGDEFFIQERIDCVGDCNIGLPCQACGSSGQGIGEFNIDLFKDVVLDVEVKRVHSFILRNEILPLNPSLEHFKFFIEWLEKQGINYDENPYVFLYTVKGK